MPIKNIIIRYATIIKEKEKYILILQPWQYPHSIPHLSTETFFAIVSVAAKSQYINSSR